MHRQPRSRLSFILLASFALCVHARDGFLIPPTVQAASGPPLGLSIAGSTSRAGTVKCLASPIDQIANTSELATNLTALASLSPAAFWEANITLAFPGSNAVQTDHHSGGNFLLSIEPARFGSLQLVTCGFMNTTQAAPVLASPAVTLVGTPDDDCARALNPLTQQSYPEYPWSKMKQYSSASLATADIGQYDNCLSQRDTTYCSVGIPPAVMFGGYCLPDLCNDDNVQAAKVSAAKQSFAVEVSLLLPAMELPSLSLAATGSSIVAAAITESISTSAMESVYFQIGQYNCHGQGWSDSPGYPNEVWLWATPLIILVAMCLLATLVDITLLQPDEASDSPALEQPELEASWGYWLAKQLSLLSSWSSLTEHRPGNLQFFDGVRFFAATWVVLGHMEVEMLSPATGVGNRQVLFPYNNGDEAESKTWWWSIIPGGFFAVDTFFWIAGFFGMFVMLRKAVKVRSIVGFGSGIPLMWLGRWLRLVPSVATALGGYWLLLPSIGSGPAWPYQDPINKACSDNWWRELLFLTSWGPQDWMTCIGVTWYLTADFFYFVCTPFIVLLHMVDQRASIGVLAGLLVACITGNTVYAHQHHDAASAFINMADPALSASWGHMYMKPWMRASPYIVGMLYGIWYNHVTQRVKNTGEPRQLKTWQSLGIQFFGGGLLMYCIFGYVGEVRSVQCSTLAGTAVQPFDPADCDTRGTSPQWTDDFYNGFSRPLFALGLSCLAEGWIWGGSWNFARWLLSLPIMAPLGKLSFNVYLWHYLIKDWYNGEMRNVANYTRLSQLVWWLGVVYIAFAVALIVYLFVEEPLAKLVTTFLKSLEAALKQLMMHRKVGFEREASKPLEGGMFKSEKKLTADLEQQVYPEPLTDDSIDDQHLNELIDDIYKRPSI